MKPSRSSLLPLLFLLFGLAATGLTHAAGADKDDVAFMKKAAVAGLFEVQASELARTRATHPELKSFAEMMVRDHTRMSNELKSLAQRKAVTLPSTLDDDHREKLEDLSKESAGKDFDDAYVEMMIDGHDDAVDLFEDAAEDAKDADVKALALKSLPVIKMHKQHAKRLDERDDS